MRTSHAPSGTCYIANVPNKVTAEELKDAFSDSGKVEFVALRRFHLGFGADRIMSITSDAVCLEANEADPIFVLDRQLYMEHAQKTRGVSKPVEPSDTHVVLKFQGGSEVEVRAMFGTYADNILAVWFKKKEADQRREKLSSSVK